MTTSSFTDLNRYIYSSYGEGRFAVFRRADSKRLGTIHQVWTGKQHVASYRWQAWTADDWILGDYETLRDAAERLEQEVAPPGQVDKMSPVEAYLAGLRAAQNIVRDSKAFRHNAAAAYEINDAIVNHLIDIENQYGITQEEGSN